jgi:hypothetical protein
MPFAQDVVTIIGVVLGVPALLFAGRQLKQAKTSSVMQALMDVESLLRQHQDVHAKLRPGGAWEDQNTGPDSTEEWISVEQYMGLFERMKIAMLDNGALDPGTFYRMYGYRILNIDQNNVIRTKKLEKEAPRWRDFIELRDLMRKEEGLSPRPKVLPAEPRSLTSWIQRRRPSGWRLSG